MGGVNMKNELINEDLKSLQDLQEKYQMKKKDIFDRLISDDINDKETVVKELDEIEKKNTRTIGKKVIEALNSK